MGQGASKMDRRSSAIIAVPAVPSSTRTAFDYAALPLDLAERQRGRASRIAGVLRRTVEAAGEIGRELLAAQAELEHGRFLQWVEAATGLSKSRAYRFMDVAAAFGERLPTVGSLPLTVVQKLAEKSTPEPVRAAVLRRIEAGETIQTDTILEEIRGGREEARKLASKTKEVSRRAALSPKVRAAEASAAKRMDRGKAALTSAGGIGQAAQMIAEEMGDKAAVLADLLRGAGAEPLADALQAAAEERNAKWPLGRVPASDREAEQSRRGRITADLSSLIAQADHVATILPDAILEAIEERAWAERISASGAGVSRQSPFAWVTGSFPDGIGSNPKRIVTMLEFAMFAQEHPRQSDLDLDRICNRKPDDRHKFAERAIKAFEKLIEEPVDAAAQP